MKLDDHLTCFKSQSCPNFRKRKFKISFFEIKNLREIDEFRFHNYPTLVEETLKLQMKQVLQQNYFNTLLYKIAPNALLELYLNLN